MRDSSTEALLFDLGGVVFAIDFDKVFAHWAALAHVPAETIKSRYRMDECYERHERGEITASEYFHGLRGTLGLSLSDEQFASGWNALFEPEPAGAFQLFESLSTQMPIYAFSNSNRLHRDFWGQKYARTLSLFSKVFVSCDLGLRKPESAAFHRVADSIGIAPRQILFFDDTEENIQGALDIGMPAVHIGGTLDLASKVTPFLD
jgi:putative hydrolase of the HAD superfamily